MWCLVKSKQVFESPVDTPVWAGFAKPARLKGLQSDPGPAIWGRIRNTSLGTTRGGFERGGVIKRAWVRGHARKRQGPVEQGDSEE